MSPEDMLNPEAPLGEGAGVSWTLLLALVTGLLTVIGACVLGLVHWIDRTFTQHDQTFVRKDVLEQRLKALEERNDRADKAIASVAESQDETLRLVRRIEGRNPRGS